jgi:hypothetical protein
MPDSRGRPVVAAPPFVGFLPGGSMDDGGSNWLLIDTVVGAR